MSSEQPTPRRDRTLLKGGCVLTMDRAIGDFEVADVLLQGSTIEAIATNLHATDAEVIDASNTIVMPGFVDTHRHLWEGILRNILPDGTLQDYFRDIMGVLGIVYRPEDVYAGTLVSALGAINAGITSILDWAHIQSSPDHTDQSIRALHDAGIRAVFAYGPPGSREAPHKFPEDIRRIRAQYFASDDQLLTLALATAGPDMAGSEGYLRDHFRLAREVGARISVHAGMAGVARIDGLAQFHREGLLGPDTTYIHCPAFRDEEWELVADTGGTVSIASPIELQMGHGTPPMQAALDHGIRPSLSADVETSTPSDFFTQMQSVLATQRGLLHARAHAGETNLPTLLGVRDVLEFATVEGARANGLERKVGTLTPGKQADVILLRTDRINVMPVNHAAGAVVLGMDTSNVDSVFVAGKALKRDGQLVGVDLNRIHRLVKEARDSVVSRSGFKGSLV